MKACAQGNYRMVQVIISHRAILDLKSKVCHTTTCSTILCITPCIIIYGLCVYKHASSWYRLHMSSFSLCICGISMVILKKLDWLTAVFDFFYDLKFYTYHDLQGGDTAVMYAVRGDHVSIVKELLLSGADPTIRNNVWQRKCSQRTEG